MSELEQLHFPLASAGPQLEAYYRADDQWRLHQERCSACHAVRRQSPHHLDLAQACPTGRGLLWDWWGERRRIADRRGRDVGR